MSAAGQFHVDEVSPSYWRVTFDNGSVNLLDPDTIDQLGALIGRIENDPDLMVVVFRSDKPGYFMAHWDFLADNARVTGADVDGQGRGTVAEQRLHQLIRQPGPITDRTFETPSSTPGSRPTHSPSARSGRSAVSSAPMTNPEQSDDALAGKGKRTEHKHSASSIPGREIVQVLTDPAQSTP